MQLLSAVGDVGEHSSALVYRHEVSFSRCDELGKESHVISSSNCSRRVRWQCHKHEQFWCSWTRQCEWGDGLHNR